MNISESNTKTNVQLMSICMQMGLEGGERAVFMLVGEPGIAKTKGVEAVAAKLSETLDRSFASEIWSGPQIQAEDAAGLPFPDPEMGRTRLLPLRIGLKVLDKKTNPSGAGIVCIDEFGSLSPAQEAAFLNFLQGGRLGEEVLPTKVALGAMMNPEDAGASAGRSLSAAAANRLVWIPWTLDPNAWFDYMLGGEGLAASIRILPKNWEKNHGHIARSLIVSYLRKNPSALQAMPPEQEASKAWPSPRSWETAARLLAAVTSTGDHTESDLANLAVMGCVGESHSEPFMTWLFDLKLPDPEALLSTTAEKALKMLPDRNDYKAVALEAVAVAACQDREDKPQRWEAAWKIVGPVFMENNPVGMRAAKILATATGDNDLKDVEHPPETRQVVPILRRAGII